MSKVEPVAVAAMVPVVIAFGIACGLLDAYAVWKIYGWHLVPLGLPTIPYAAAVAVDMIVSLLTGHLVPETEKTGTARLFLRPIIPSILLGVASWLR